MGPEHRRGRHPHVLTLAALALAGCPADPERAAAPADLAALDSGVAAFARLDAVGARELVACAWNDGEGVPLRLVRAHEGWEEQDGLACARIATLLHHERRRHVFGVDWLRPAGDRVVCVARAVGGERRAVVPPQPVLVAPLEAGTAWTWSGVVGGVEASASFVVRRVEERALPDGTRARVVDIEQTTRAGGLTATRTQTWAEGRGLVGEEGDFPVGEPGQDVDRLRARVMSASEAPGH